MENYALGFEIESYIESKSSYFDAASLDEVRKLIYASHRPMNDFYSLKFKSPIVATVLSVALGLFGIDRFYTGNYIMGAIKLITHGGCMLWYFLDWKFIGKGVKAKNLEKLRAFAQENLNVTKTSVDSNTVVSNGTNDEFVVASQNIIDAFKDVAETMDVE